jgi:hypothetical protein
MRAMVWRFFVCAVAVFGLSAARGADAERFEVLKGIHYYQVGEGAAILQTNNCYRFSAQVYASVAPAPGVAGSVLAAAVTTPKSQRIDLLADQDGDPFRFRDRFDPDDRFAFENFFPNGTYSLFIRGRNDGDHTMTFSITGDQYPQPPILNDYNGAQSLPYNQYNEISWRPFVGGTASDFIQVQIEDGNGNNIWETPDFGEAGALNGLDTRTVIPARQLAPGSVYFGTIRFVKVLSSGSRQYAGVPGTAGYFTRTEFVLRAVSSTVDSVVDRVQVWRRQRWDQSVVDGVLREQIVEWEFLARLDTVETNQVASVGLGLPGSTNDVFLISDPLGDDEFELSRELETSLTSFLTLYPNGPYTFNVNRRDAKTERVVVDLPDGTFAPPPRILNVTSFANHPGRTNLVVAWEPWSGAGPLDFIRVALFDEGTNTWDTANFSSPKRLKADTTYVVIPGEALIPGHDYRVEVHFYHVTVNGTRISPGALVFGGFDTQTRVEFTTGLPDVKSFRVAEGQYMWQRGTDPIHILPDPNGRFRFEASAIGATTNSLLAAQVTVPTGVNLELARAANADAFELSRTNIEISAEALAANYPTGIYRFHFATVNDGAKTSVVNVASTELPPIPHVRLFTNLTSLSFDSPYNLTWTPWVGANTNTDSIRFTLYAPGNNLVFDSDDGDALLATTNRVIIPAKAFEKNDKTVFIARLRFERREKSEDPLYPGARATAARFSETAVYIATMPGFKIRFADVDPRVFTISGLKTGGTYALSVSSDLSTWTRVKTLRILTLEDRTQKFTNNVTDGAAFYRWEYVVPP